MLPSGGSGMRKGYIGYGSDHNGGKYVENEWQDSWQTGQSGADSGWDKKDASSSSDEGNWGRTGKHKWSWGNGGSHGWGRWSSDNGKTYRGSDSSNSAIQEPEMYAFWGNSNTDSWKNNGGGEGWHKWEGWKLIIH